MPSLPVAVRPVEPGDLDAVVRWRSAPHVARWFGQFDLAARHRLAARLTGDDAVAVLVITVGDRDVGYVEHYRLADVDAAANTMAFAGADAMGIDYVIGDAGMIGRGVGTRAIWSAASYLAAHDPGLCWVVADPEADNPASIRALAKAGFVELGRLNPDRPGRAEPSLMRLDVRHWLGAAEPCR